MAYHITRKGYRRNGTTGKFEHIEVWEQHHGRALPDGYQVHHIDENKLNNSPENLLAVTPTEHKRIHSGCELRNGEWFKPCSLCRRFKRIDTDNWYISQRGWPLYGRCRPCHIAKVVREKQMRRLRRQGAA
uniref:HNH endonuclease signature motif containing protein n=1 Tax=Mycobacteroides chelonae TaxID=1774 RepID=UPI003986D1D8